MKGHDQQVVSFFAHDVLGVAGVAVLCRVDVLGRVDAKRLIVPGACIKRKSPVHIRAIVFALDTLHLGEH